MAIFGSADLSVDEINPNSLSLKGLSVRMVGKSNKLLIHKEDVDVDGYLDLVVQFEDSDGWLADGSGYATLSGAFLDGTLINGRDTICIVP